MATVLEKAPTVGIAPLCDALGLSRATFYRRSPPTVAPTRPAVDPVSDPTLGDRRLGVVCDHGTEGANAPPTPLAEKLEPDAARHGTDPTTPPVSENLAASVPLVPEPPALESAPSAPSTQPQAPQPAAPKRRPSHRALSAAERARVLAVLHEERFQDRAPAEVYATLLDEGCHLCSERTMYRILEENRELRERRNLLRHPTYVAPELMATKPNQLWSWDITKLKTFVKCQYLHLYVILDVFSRCVVGWMVAEREDGELAKALIDTTCERHNIQPGELTFHADNGAAMVSQPVAFLLASLGIIKSHSRPHVSDDNPFSEAQFKTLKYRPDFPERFASLEHARTFLRAFFAWYNTQHHHAGLALLTPHDVHYGLAPERLAQRAQVLSAAYAAHPERFVRRPPKPAPLPTAVYINPPKSTTATQETRA